MPLLQISQQIRLFQLLAKIPPSTTHFSKYSLPIFLLDVPSLPSTQNSQNNNSVPHSNTLNQIDFQIFAEKVIIITYKSLGNIIEKNNFRICRDEKGVRGAVCWGLRVLITRVQIVCKHKNSLIYS
jgi:hypothetical protein